MTQEIKKRTHARYSPSTLSALQKCPRYRFDETESMKEAGAEGEFLHACCETGSTAGLDEKQRIDVESCRGYVESIRAGISGIRWELAEGKLTLAGLTHGHADLCILDVERKTLHVVDYKFGRTQSDPGEQLRAYGAAATEMLISPEGLGFGTADCQTIIQMPDLKTVITHVVAPRLDDGPVMDTYDAQELLVRVRKDIEALYARIDDPWTPENPEYPELCARCARAGRCPSVNKAVARMAPALGITIPTIFDLSLPVTPEERAIRQSIRGLMDKWCEKCGQENSEFAIAGGNIPGFRLQIRSNGFKVPRESTKTALDILNDRLQLPLDVVAGSLTLSVSELSKQLAQVTPETESVWKGKLMEALEGVGTNSSSTFLVKEAKGKAKKELN